MRLQACDWCRRRKNKCSGMKLAVEGKSGLAIVPCMACDTTNRVCRYTTSRRLLSPLASSNSEEIDLQHQLDNQSVKSKKKSRESLDDDVEAVNEPAEKHMEKDVEPIEKSRTNKEVIEEDAEEIVGNDANVASEAPQTTLTSSHMPKRRKRTKKPHLLNAISPCTSCKEARRKCVRDSALSGSRPCERCTNLSLVCVQQEKNIGEIVKPEKKNGTIVKPATRLTPQQEKPSPQRNPNVPNVPYMPYPYMPYPPYMPMMYSPMMYAAAMQHPPYWASMPRPLAAVSEAPMPMYGMPMPGMYPSGMPGYMPYMPNFPRPSSEPPPDNVDPLKPSEEALDELHSHD
jgi:hypothetical protein